MCAQITVLQHELHELQESERHLRAQLTEENRERAAIVAQLAQAKLEKSLLASKQNH